MAFPTETVYGLGAHALDAAAVARIFAVKGRPSYNPLIVHVADADAARALAADWPARAERLAAAFWPGPLTLVVARRPIVPDIVTAGLPTVALRVPAHPVALALLRAAALPVAAPSANRSTELSPTTARHVAQALGDQVPLVLDAGPTPVGIESTVVDVTGAEPLLLRPGTLSVERLSEALGEPVRAAPPPSDPAAPRAAPGMLDRHYAPRATVVLLDDAGRDAALARARDAMARGERVGALLLGPATVPATHPVRMPADPAAYAQLLYATLHDLDDAGCALVLVEPVPGAGAWDGVRDRLRRARG